MINRPSAALCLAALCIPVNAMAQSSRETSPAAATIEVLGTVTVNATDDLDFGDWTSGGFAISSDVGAYGGWAVTMDGSHDVQLGFVLPAVLMEVGGSGDEIPVTYGPEAAHYAGIVNYLFDPVSGTTINNADGSFSVLLGDDLLNNSLGDVVVEVNGAPAGVYTGTITLTVTIL